MLSSFHRGVCSLRCLNSSFTRHCVRNVSSWKNGDVPFPLLSADDVNAMAMKLYGVDAVKILSNSTIHVTAMAPNVPFNGSSTARGLNSFLLPSYLNGVGVGLATLAVSDMSVPKSVVDFFVLNVIRSFADGIVVTGRLLNFEKSLTMHFHQPFRRVFAEFRRKYLGRNSLSHWYVLSRGWSLNYCRAVFHDHMHENEQEMCCILSEANKQTQPHALTVYTTDTYFDELIQQIEQDTSKDPGHSLTHSTTTSSASPAPSSTCQLPNGHRMAFLPLTQVIRAQNVLRHRRGLRMQEEDDENAAQTQPATQSRKLEAFLLSAAQQKSFVRFVSHAQPSLQRLLHFARTSDLLKSLSIECGPISTRQLYEQLYQQQMHSTSAAAQSHLQSSSASVSHSNSALSSVDALCLTEYVGGDAPLVYGEDGEKVELNSNVIAALFDHSHSNLEIEPLWKYHLFTRKR